MLWISLASLPSLPGMQGPAAKIRPMPGYAVEGWLIALIEYTSCCSSRMRLTIRVERICVAILIRRTSRMFDWSGPKEPATAIAIGVFVCIVSNASIGPSGCAMLRCSSSVSSEIRSRAGSEPR